MVATSARLLRLVALLTARPWWSAAELAARLEVTERTVRRDIDRLRTLDYPVVSVPGPGGGYRLGPGGDVPPLQLDADEAVAIAVCLRVAAGAGVSGIEEAAPRALAKLERMLPPRARARAAAIEAATVPFGGASAPLDPDVLLTVAEACRAEQRLRFTYTARDDATTRRHVEPFRIVPAVGRWYLVARDVDRDAWRTFRLDRVSRPFATTERTRLVDPPDAARLVSEALGVGPYRHVAHVRFDAPVDEVRARVPPSVGVLEADGDAATLLTTGADRLGTLAGHLGMVGLAFTVLDPPELREELTWMAERLRAAATEAGG
jgi:predicted DNA-binding transcriptional regulator YafY